MKKIIFVILDKFANWELAYLSAALGNEQLGTTQYTVLYASTDKEAKTSIGNLKALPDLSIWEIPEDISALVFIGAEGSWRNLSKDEILSIGIERSIFYLIKSINGMLHIVQQTIHCTKASTITNSS